MANLSSDLAPTSVQAPLEQEHPGIVLRTISAERATELQVLPEYEWLHTKLLKLLQCVEAPNSEELKRLLLATHPALPVLTGGVRIENPELEIPLVFKLAYPKIKELNAVLGQVAVDELGMEIQRAFQEFFSEDLTLLNVDFKGGKAILRLKGGLQSGWEAFKTQTDAFQGRLGTVVREFLDQRGFSSLLKERPKMVFGATPWEPQDLERGQPLAEALVRRFLLAEQSCNMTLRRVVPEGVGENYHPRGLAMRMTEPEYFEYLEKDLEFVVKLLSGLRQRLGSNPELAQVFDAADVPALSFDFLTAWRKGTLEERFPSLSADDVKWVATFLAVLNTVDVLKPFTLNTLPAFLLRLDVLAQLVKGETSLEELERAFSNSLKAPENEVVCSRFGFARKLLSFARTDSSNEVDSMVYMSGDVVGLGANNIHGYWLDLLTYSGTKENDSEKARTGLLMGAGDRCTQLLQGLRDRLAPHVWALDASGGDELGVLLERRALPHVEEVLQPTNGVPVRRCYYDLSDWVGCDVDHLAERWALMILDAEQELETQKHSVKQDNSCHLSQ